MSTVELRRGDLVEVKSPAEILATLDERGALENLPFMSEMAAMCGRRFVVDRRAERVCDTVAYTGTRTPPRSVFLEDIRCDGSAHGGCQAECRPVWKEEWLRKVTPETAPSPPPVAADLQALLARTNGAAQRTVDTEKGPQVRWWCQITELPRASVHQKLWDPRSYLRELTTGNVTVGHFLRVTSRAAVQEPMRKLGMIPEVHLPGTRTSSEKEGLLDLQPGELVQVKSRDEIAATLTPEGRHRGLWFDREMMPYCGGTYRVRQRIRLFIDEKDGRMIELKNDCVTLEGVICSGDLSLRRWFCSRAIFPYWREAWLRRVEAPAHASAAVPAAQAATTAP